MDQQEQIALVTGANRGIGLEVCRQLANLGFIVFLGSRDQAKGEAAARGLQQPVENVRVCQLDITDETSIQRTYGLVTSEYGRLDVLVNNAAILYDDWETVSEAPLDTMRQAFETNTLGALRMCQVFLPLLRLSQHGRIVNVSSEAGSISRMGAYCPAYNLSKAGLNALTRMFAYDLRGTRILVNSVCPGWVATDMGGAGGRPVDQGAASVLWAILLPDDGPSGGFFQDGQPLPW